MKKLLPLFLTLFALNAVGAPCNGAPGSYHQNSDGSNGGFVARGAQVSNTAYLDASVEICGMVKLTGSPRIFGNTVIDEFVTISGVPTIHSSRIFGYAKISGGAVIQNATICQGSLIEGFKVINSNYYCQTEDPAPKDPGEAGRKTLLGVDSDGDGVRDDIEAFINNSLPNTPTKNYAIERTATKLYAKILQKELVVKSSPEIVKNLLQVKVDLSSCYQLSISDDVFINMYDTHERLFSLFKVAGYVHGEEIRKPSKTCRSLRAFDTSVDLL